MTAVVGVVGGRGDVGSHAVRALRGRGCAVRIGGRSAPSGPNERVVDFRSESTVDEFCAGLDVLLNCAGPSREIGDVLAVAAHRAGADYVDVAGDEALHALLDPAGPRVAVLSAGLRPGLSGLFPRAVAAEFDRVDALEVHFGLLDRFTEVAAADYLQGVADGLTRPSAGWRGGARRTGEARRTDVELPHFPGRATVLTQLSTEDERLAAELGLERGDWRTVLCGEHVPAVFDRVRGTDRATAIADLRRASLLDLAGRSRFVTMTVRADGERGGAPESRTAVLHGAGNAELSGEVAAAAVAAVLAGTVPAGRHYAADVLDARAVVAELSARVTWPADDDEEGVL